MLFPFFALFCFMLLKVEAIDFPYEPPKNFTLSYSSIALHHPVSTHSAEAQLYFDQGLTFLYAFNHDAAYWSFLKASEADPQLAMAYWGMSFVLGKNLNNTNDPQREIKAYQLYQQALKHESKASESERAYIATLSKRYTDQPNPDFAKSAIAYSQAIGTLHEKYPDDPDAAVLFAESLMNLPISNDWTQSTPKSVKILEKVLKQYPDHLGANHFYIHVIEVSPHPEWALISADRMKHLLPASGHIKHMPSHIYFVLGDFHESVLANNEGVAADKMYIQKYGVYGNYAVHYLSHNLYFLARSYMMEGNFVRAKETAEELEHFILPHIQDMEEFATTPLLVLLRFNKWNEILKREEPDKKKLPMVYLLWLYSKSMAYAGLGDVSKAVEEQKRFEEAISHLPKNYQFSDIPNEQLLSLPSALIKARIFAAQGNNKSAEETLFETLTISSSLGYHNFPDWFFPVREYLGVQMLRNAQYAKAEKIFREDLEIHPRNRRSLFGLHEALKKQSRKEDLYWVEQQYQKASLYSDTDLTLSW